MKHLLALALLCASAAHAQTGVVEWWLDNNPAKAYSTQAKCDAAALALNIDKAYPCPRMYRTKPKPIPCPSAPPAAQTVQCAAPTTGTWGQTRNVASAPSPQCWVTGVWTPATPPAGACTTPPVATWSLLGLEDDVVRLTVAAGSTVRYGAGVAWIEKVIAGTSFVCWNGEFGSDPAPNVRKQCELRSGTVPAPVVGSASVRWTAPTTNADGTPLTDLAGYRILYGPASGNYTASIAASASPVIVQNLSAGAWFFVIRAVDTAGFESTPTAEVSKTIQ